MEQVRHWDKKAVSLAVVKRLTHLAIMMWVTVGWTLGLVAIVEATPTALDTTHLEPGTLTTRFFVLSYAFWLLGYLALGILGLATEHIWIPKLKRFFFERE